MSRYVMLCHVMFAACATQTFIQHTRVLSSRRMSNTEGTVQLSKSWKVVRQHRGFYTGGKVVLSSSNRFLVCLHGEDLCLLELSTGTVAHTVEAESDAILAFALHKNEQDLVIACQSGLIKHIKLDLENKKHTVARSFKGHESEITDITFDSSCTLIATASLDRSVRVWNLLGGFCTHVLRGHHQRPVRYVSFCPSKLLLVSADDEGGLCAWTLHPSTGNNSNKKKQNNVDAHPLVNHMSAVTAVCFSNDQSKLVSVSRDKVINTWCLQTFALLHTSPVFESMEGVVMLPSALAASFNASSAADHFVTCGESGSLKVWNLQTHKCVHTHNPHGPGVTLSWTSLLMSENSCISVSAEHNFYVWNLSNPKQLFTRQKLLLGFNDEIVSVKCVPGSQWTALATNSEQIRLINVQTFDADLLTGHTDIVLSLDISPCGKYLASAAKDNTIRIWDISTLNNADCSSRKLSCVAIGKGHTEAVAAVAFSKKVASMFVVSGSKDRTLKMWNLNDLSASDNNEIPSLTAVQTVLAHDKDINAVCVAPNDKMIATASADKTIKLWNAADLTLLNVLRGHKRGVWAVEFSNVDRVLATASGDRSIRVWSVTDGSCLKTLEGHASAVLNCAFVTHGCQLLSGAADGGVKLWTLKTGECVNTFEEHADKVWSLSAPAQSAGSNSMCVTGGGDSLLNVWEDVTSQEQAAEDEAAAQRVLKEQELSNCVKLKQWAPAVQLAIDLDQPRRLLGIFEEVITEENDCIPSKSIMPSLLDALSKEHIGRLLFFCRDWNTHGKHALIAHAVLAALFKNKTPQELKQYPTLKEVLPALVPYTERHFARLDAMLQKSFLIDYTLLSMKKLAPLEEQAPESSSAALFEISHQPDQAIVEALQQQQQATEPDVSEVEPKPAKTSKRKQQEEVVVEEAEPVKKKSSKRK